MDSFLEGGTENDALPKKKKKHQNGYEFEGENGFAEFGGYMDAKISKLDQQYQSSKDSVLQESNLFAGISIFVNGFTNPSSGELKLIMMRHGGTFHTYQRSHTDYIIASNLPDVKIRNHTTKTIVRPEWISRCLEEKRIVDFAPYLLVTKRNRLQPRITFQENPSEIQKQKSHDSTASNVSNDIATTVPEKKEAPSKNQARTANDPNFLAEFYNNSRLHHISTLGATFKQHISDLREAHAGEFKDRQVLMNNITARESYEDSSPLVMHIDMDCFFVSVGLRSRPELLDQPVAVTHSKGKSVQVRPGSDLNYEHKAFHERFGEKFGNSQEQLDKTISLSEIASCSYAAREKGVRNGMFVGSALKLCPDLKTIPYDFEGYKEVAFTLYNTIAQYTLDIEAVSCDEMYVDLSSLLRATGVPVMEFVSYVRDEIKTKTGCPCSAGVGSNRIQARMATKQAKPNGQFHLPPENVQNYFKDILITDLPGVGRSTTAKLEKMNWKTCGDLQKVPIKTLQRELGKKFGETVHQLASGKDEKALNFGQSRRSVSAEVNYGIRFKEPQELEAFLTQLCGEVQNRLIEARRKGKCVTLKYMVRAPDAPVETAKFMGHGVCDVTNKSLNLNDFTADAEVIKKAVLQLNSDLNIPPEELRGIGIQVTKLDGASSDGRLGDPKDSRLMEMFSKVQKKNELKEATITAGPNGPIAVQRTSISPSKKANSPVKRGRPKKGTKNLKTKPLAELLRPSNPDSDLDQDVLNELPDELREEAIRSHRFIKRHNSASNMANNDQKRDPPPALDEDFLAALPPDIRREVEMEMGLRRSPAVEVVESEEPIEKETTKVSPENIFLQSDWKSVLEAWLVSTDVPNSSDIIIVVGFWKELIVDHRFESVYSHFRYFYRIINSSNNCDWHKIYAVISKEIQETMLSVLKRKLAIHERVTCNKCNN